MKAYASMIRLLALAGVMVLPLGVSAMAQDADCKPGDPNCPPPVECTPGDPNCPPPVEDGGDDSEEEEEELGADDC